MRLTDRSARSGLCCRSRCEVAPRCTTKLENTHGTEFRELLYPWHPWFGLRFGVHAAIERSSGTVFRCSLSGSDADRWLEVPAWMFDRSACAKVRVADAHVDLTALTNLAAIVQRPLHRASAAPKLPTDRIKLTEHPDTGALDRKPLLLSPPLTPTPDRSSRFPPQQSHGRAAGTFVFPPRPEPAWPDVSCARFPAIKRVAEKQKSEKPRCY